MELKTVFLVLVISCAAKCMVDHGAKEAESIAERQQEDRDAKLFNVFTVVRFKNDPCQGTSSRNGTCYTESECTNRGGSNSGSCAQGFGVCCTFIANCGASVAENCTYFESRGGEQGACSIQICPCSSGICQMRLDFTNFVVTGPSTSIATVGTATNGQPAPNGKVPYGLKGQCLTDQFTVRTARGGGNGAQPPTICGVNSGEHMYADMEGSNCNSLDFQLGGTGVDATIPTRQWSIKVTQIDCNSNLRAPDGCTQYFYGTSVNTVRSYNFNQGNGQHLANQQQNVCIRKERGQCKLCWSAIDPLDVDTNGKNDAMKGTLGKNGMCCSYGDVGTTGTLGYDCLVIPGAAKGTACDDFTADNLNANRFCGNSKGLAISKTATTDAKVGTVCTKSEPFTLQFLSDAIEFEEEAKEDLAAGKPGSGFQLAYFMSSKGC